MLKKLGVALTFGPVGPVIYALIRWGDNKEILATPVFLVTLATFGFGLVFAYFFGPWESTTSTFKMRLLFVLAFLMTGIAVGIIDIAWPAEPVNSLPEVENWQVLEEYTDFNGLIVSKVHQDPNDPNKLGFTMWFPNKDKSYVLEVFVRMVDFIKNGEKTDASRVKGIIKLQNGNWSEMVAVDKILRSEGLLNGKPAIIFRAVDDNGETKFFRAFLLKDLAKPKN